MSQLTLPGISFGLPEGIGPLDLDAEPIYVNLVYGRKPEARDQFGFAYAQFPGHSGRPLRRGIDLLQKYGQVVYLPSEQIPGTLPEMPIKEQRQVSDHG